jgi:hypothetical protein
MHGLAARLAAAPVAREAVPPPVVKDAKPAGVLASGGATLRRDGEGWTVVHEGRAARLRDARGLGYLATLLAHPDQEFHALDLEGGDDEEAGGGGVLDAAERERWARQLADLRDELEEARGFNDPGRAERAEERIEALSAELAKRVQGGAAQRSGAAAERARVNVTRAIARAVERIGAVHPALGQHLTATLRTGAFCRYAPDPRLPLRWEL